MTTSSVPTVRDVARAAGVTPMTVSRVLRATNGYSTETRERVLAAARELGYTPNALAQSLRTRQTHTVALLIGNVASPFYAQLARGFEAAARAEGYLAMICNTDQSPEQEARYLAELRMRRVDGLAVAPVDTNAPALRAFLAHQVPVVLVDREAASSIVDGVTADSRAGAAAATRHLIQVHGHRRIAAICGPAETSTGRDRREGFEAAMREAKLPVDPRLVGHCAYTLEAARDLARRLLSRRPRPTALLAAGNFLTAGALEAVTALGLDVPGDVALIGFGPVPRSALERPDLTMVGLPSEAMGRRAAQLLLERIRRGAASTGRGTAGPAPEAVERRTPPNPLDSPDGPVRESFPVTLLVGRSCGCPAAAPGPRPTTVPAVGYPEQRRIG